MKTSTEPVIGIIICGYMNDRQFVPQSYIDAVICAGGVPLLIPCVKDTESFPHYGRLCDGFLFCGGDDISPFLFGEEPLTDQGCYDQKTDVFHLSFMKYALSLHLPVLGICRGMQILNVALGGTLFQDLSLRFDTTFQHKQLSLRREDTSHKITVSPNSMLYKILGNSVYVNSFHHQAVHLLGDRLKITAISSDGVIEAIELPGHPFVLGVQWHPECMWQTVPSMSDIFLAFINSSSTAKNLQYIPPVRRE